MRIVLVGAAEPTGRCLVRELGERGHQLVVIVHEPELAPSPASAFSPASATGGVGSRRSDPAPFPVGGPELALGTRERWGNVEFHHGSIGESAVLAGALAGRPDVVVSTVGPRPGASTLGDLATQLVAMMPDAGVQRFVGLSSAGVAVRGDRRWPRDRAVRAFMRRCGGSALGDQQREYDIWSVSDLHWTLVRAPSLITESPSGTGRDRGTRCVAHTVDDAVEHHAHRTPRRTSISRTALACFLADSLERGQYVRQAPLIARR